MMMVERPDKHFGSVLISVCEGHLECHSIHRCAAGAAGVRSVTLRGVLRVVLEDSQRVSGGVWTSAGGTYMV